MRSAPPPAYQGPDPDGFMSRGEVVALLEGYARSFAAPVEAGVEVTALERDGDGFRVEAPGRRWRARAVVIATGQCDRPAVPALAAALPRWVTQIVPSAYRSPDRLPPGGVLVVGASATGIQLVDELHRSGRR